MEKRWVFQERADADKVQQLSGKLNIQYPLAELLVQRNISSFDSAKAFFRPGLDQLHDPFLMKNMDVAVNRLCEAISNQDKILIYGDYDVDGTTSVALTYGFLSEFTDQLDFYIPDRYTEGYGISSQGIEFAHQHGFKLIISLDCGIRAVDKAALANRYGIDLIICDHHLPGDELPDALAILDPKQKDCNYPFKELSGCGVGFKLLQGFCIQNTIPMEQLYVHLDLVAVSIAADIVPIVGENRTLAYYGLKKINVSPCPGLRALIEISGLKGEIDITGILFYIGPRINAAGRLKHAKESVRLLIAKTDAETQIYAEGLHLHNKNRKDFDQNITREALDMIEGDDLLKAAKSTVLFKNNWHKGVIGIVASRCIESYYRPTIILTESQNKATGSARSVDGFDIHEAIDACSDLLEQFGGHTHAAGLTLALENVDAFRVKFEEIVSNTIENTSLTPKVDVDLTIDFDFINFRNYEILRQMSPFGPENMNPVFCSRSVQLKTNPRILKEQHLKLNVAQDGSNETFDAIGFGLGHLNESLLSAKTFSMVYHIEENNFRGNKTLQLNIKDIKID